MTRFQRHVVQMAEKLAAEVGGTCSYEAGKRHDRLIIAYNGQHRVTPISGSPNSEGDALKYKMADVRRILRDLGAKGSADA